MQKMLKTHETYPVSGSCFHSSKSQNARYIDVKKCLYKKRSNGNFEPKNLNTTIIMKTVIKTEGIAIH